MPRRAILFANGELTDANAIRFFIHADDVIICADGGSRHALALGLNPDLVIGDLDSIAPDDLNVLQRLGCQIEQHPVDKDATDLELALLAAQRLGIAEVILVAALGGRLDQTLGNLMLMANPSFVDLHLTLVDGRQTVSVVRDQITITGSAGDTVSALPLSPVVEGLIYSGLRWPLQDATLPFGSTRGISNEMTGTTAHISLRSGILLVVHTTRKPGNR
jgi:thiamine pyrophosphokinase